MITAPLPRPRRSIGGLRAWLPASLGVAALLLAACTTPPSSTGAASSIKRDWVAFFAGSTSAMRKAALLQDGTELLPLLQQESASAEAKSVSATVSKVSITSPTTATVTYDIALGGMTVLSNQTGVSLKERGTWKVALSSFCGLLSLEQVRAPACSGSTGSPGSPGASLGTSRWPAAYPGAAAG